MSPNTLCIGYDGPVNDINVTQFMHRVASSLNPTITKLYIRLNTGGGSVNSGINLYNYLRGLKLEIITHNVGKVDSVGNIIFVAGDKRYADPHSTFLFHGVTLDVMGNARFTPTQLGEHLSQLKQDEKRIKAIIVERTQIGGQKLAALFKAGKSLDPSQALTYGVIDEIKDFGGVGNSQNPPFPPLPVQN